MLPIARRGTGWGLFLLPWILCVPELLWGAQGTFTTDVPPGKWKSVRVRNLPVSAVVSVQAESSGSVGVAFLDSSDLRAYPSPANPLFQGQFEDKLSFSVTIPSQGDYYVLFDNRRGNESRSIKVTIAGKRGDRVRVNPASIEKFQDSLDEFERKLTNVFIFEPFPLKIKQCGVARAFATTAGVVLCAEYAKKLYDTLGDKEKTRDAILFTVFHEIGHVFLRQWHSPVYDNEDVADEFAAAIMMLFGLRERLVAKAEFFASQPARTEALAKALKDDRHSLSVQRARNILRWAGDSSLLRKWEGQFVPHMQTQALEKLLDRDNRPFDREAIEKELQRRKTDKG